jgi:hypothetical protein
MIIFEIEKENAMTNELNPNQPAEQGVKVKYQGGSSEAVYGLGLIGAWVYYLSRATTFREGVVGFFKGLFWPAFLVYAMFKYLEKP